MGSTCRPSGHQRFPGVQVGSDLVCQQSIQSWTFSACSVVFNGTFVHNKQRDAKLNLALNSTDSLRLVYILPLSLETFFDDPPHECADFTLRSAWRPGRCTPLKYLREERHEKVSHAVEMNAYYCEQFGVTDAIGCGFHGTSTVEASAVAESYHHISYSRVHT